MNNPDTPPKPDTVEQPADEGLDETSCCASFRELTPDEVIQKGDQYLPAGLPPEDDANWKPAYETIGRTVREQLAREWNAAEKFRRECTKEECYRAALEYELRLAEKQVELLKLRVEEGGHDHVKPFGTDAWKRAERLRAILRHNDEDVHHYQRERASITGLGL